MTDLDLKVDYMNSLIRNPAMKADDFEKVKNVLEQLNKEYPHEYGDTFETIKEQCMLAADEAQADLAQLHIEAKSIVRVRTIKTNITRGIVVAVVAATVYSTYGYTTYGELKWLEPIKKWTATVLQQRAERSPEPVVISDELMQYFTMRDAQSAYNVHIPYFTEMPEAFVLEHVTVKHDADNNFISLQSVYGTEDIGDMRTLFIHIKLAEDSEGMITDGCEELIINSVTYYLYDAEQWQKAIWMNDGYEYKISGDVTREEIIEMVTSIKWNEK